jgi:hypothetical protein
MRPLHRLEIGTQHTIKHLENHPTAWLRWAGMRQRRTAVLEEIGFRWSPVCGSPTLVSVCGEVNDPVKGERPSTHTNHTNHARATQAGAQKVLLVEATKQATRSKQ